MGKILIVEDNPKNSKLMVDLLTVHGHETMVAEDGPVGLEMAEAEQPDLILMDVQLPGMDGYEVTKRLKAMESTKSIPIIIVTSFAMKGEERRAEEVGASAYIAKPIDIHHVIATVARFLPMEREHKNEE